MAVSEDLEPDTQYTVQRCGPAIELRSDDDLSVTRFDNSAQFLHELETRIIIGIQEFRPELLFVHAAALEHSGFAHLFSAESGSGKSTTTWALLHHGFRYLSDELSPINPRELLVYPYQHAVCLKQAPPEPYTLPQETRSTTSTLHIPPRCISLAPTQEYPLASIGYLQFDPQAREPSAHKISPGESSARLYANGLNLLAHGNSGLDAASRIATSVPAYWLTTTSDLRATCQLVIQTILSLS